MERSEMRERRSNLYHRFRISLRSIRATASAGLSCHSQSAGCGFHGLAAVAVGPQHVVAVDRDVEIVAVRIDRPILGIEAVARPLQRRSVALVLEALDDLGVILDLEAEMVKARRL